MLYQSWLLKSLCSLSSQAQTLLLHINNPQYVKFSFLLNKLLFEPCFSIPLNLLPLDKDETTTTSNSHPFLLWIKAFRSKISALTTCSKKFSTAGILRSQQLTLHTVSNTPQCLQEMPPVKEANQQNFRKNYKIFLEILTLKAFQCQSLAFLNNEEKNQKNSCWERDTSNRCLRQCASWTEFKSQQCTQKKSKVLQLMGGFFAFPCIKKIPNHNNTSWKTSEVSLSTSLELCPLDRAHQPSETTPHLLMGWRNLLLDLYR